MAALAREHECVRSKDQRHAGKEKGGEDKAASAQPIERDACSGEGDVSEVLDHVVLKRAAAVVGLVPQEEDEGEGVEVHLDAHVVCQVGALAV